MKNFDATINLPTDNLKERRSLLEAELKKTVVAQVEADLKEKLVTALADVGINNLTKLTWEFHGEYDDEGGTNYYPNYIQLFNEDGELEYEEDEKLLTIEIKQKSKQSDYVYTYDIGEFLSDTLHEYSDELYNYDIEEIIF